MNILVMEEACIPEEIFFILHVLTHGGLFFSHNF